MAEAAQQVLEDAQKVIYQELYDAMIIDEPRRPVRLVATLDEAQNWAVVVLQTLAKSEGFEQGNDDEVYVAAYQLLSY